MKETTASSIILGAGFFSLGFALGNERHSSDTKLWVPLGILAGVVGLMAFQRLRR